MQFINRQQAGILLAERLREMPLAEPLILALPRGGVVVAHEIAKALGAPLDVLVVRKVGAPIHPEFALGAVTEDGHFWLDSHAIRYVGADPAEVEQVLAREKEEVQRRIRLYREDRPLPSLRDRTVVLVDDGLATGATARVACAYLKQQGASDVLLAVPVCSYKTAELLRKEVEVVCLDEPDLFYAVGQFYEDFTQVSDQEVIRLLRGSRIEKLPDFARDVSITEGLLALNGILAIPPRAKGVVLFAHGSGSSRFSPRNQQVAKSFNRAGLGTLLLDLLAPEESTKRKNIFDISLLGGRLVLATRWLKREVANLPIGYFGASTGAGAALWAAAELGSEIAAVVSRGGRADLATPRLAEVSAPTLLLVGSKDEPVLEKNWEALPLLKYGRLHVIPGATHLFEENGAMEQVEEEAARWFEGNFTEAKRAVA